MSIEASNLSNKEYFNLNGTLSAERIEDLLDREESFKGLAQEAIDELEQFTTQNEAETLSEVADDLYTIAQDEELPEGVADRILELVKRLNDATQIIEQTENANRSETNSVIYTLEAITQD